MDALCLGQGLLTEVDQHLFPGRCIENIIINTAVLRFPVDLSGILEIVDIVAERLLVAGKFFLVSIFDEFFFQDIVNR